MFHTFEPVKSFDQFVFLAIIQLDNISIRKLCGVVSQSLVYFLCSNPIQLGNVPIEVSVSAMLVYTRQKNIAQVFILERYFFVSIYPAAIPGTYLAMFLVAVLQLC